MGKKAVRRKTKGNHMPGGSAKTCFCIMPFNEFTNTYYETIYIPAIQKAGLEPRRADDIYRPSTIVHDIWAFTQECTVAIADLSQINANVFYELGLAHAIAKPVILVTNSMDTVPFDLRALRVIVYDKDDPEWGSILKENLTKALKEVLASPTEAVLPAFLNVKKEEKPTVTAHEKELLEMKQEIEILRKELRGTSPYQPYPVHRYPLSYLEKAQDLERAYGKPLNLEISRTRPSMTDQEARARIRRWINKNNFEDPVIRGLLSGRGLSKERIQELITEVRNAGPPSVSEPAKR